MQQQPEGYSISSDPQLLDRDVVFRFLSTDGPWAEGIPRRLFERSIENSRCFGVYDADRRTAGFARVITDFRRSAISKTSSSCPNTVGAAWRPGSS
jgi:hypothetical protein